MVSGHDHQRNLVPRGHHAEPAGLEVERARARPHRTAGARRPSPCAQGPASVPAYRFGYASKLLVQPDRHRRVHHVVRGTEADVGCGSRDSVRAAHSKQSGLRFEQGSNHIDREPSHLLIAFQRRTAFWRGHVRPTTEPVSSATIARRAALPVLVSAAGLRSPWLCPGPERKVVEGPNQVCASIAGSRRVAGR